MHAARSALPLAALLATVLLAWAAPATCGTVVVLRSRALASNDSVATAFRAAFGGRVAEFQLDPGDHAALQRQIEALRPDAIVTIGVAASLFARDRLLRMPIVHALVPRPQDYALVGQWITGVASDVPAEAELEHWRQLYPEARRIAVFCRTSSAPGFARARRAARRAGIELIEVRSASLHEMATRWRDPAERADALWVRPDPEIAKPELLRVLLKHSAEQKKPLFGYSEALVRAGALAALEPDYRALGADLADRVRRIQGGERAGDLRVTALPALRLVINESVARALGRTLPAELETSTSILR